MKRLLVFSMLLVSIAVVFAPVASAQTCNTNETTHVVRYGDTVYKLSLRYNVSMQAIAIRNNITNVNRIYAGQTLCIPSTSAVVPSTLTSYSSVTTLTLSPEGLARLLDYINEVATTGDTSDSTGIPGGVTSTDPRGSEYNWCNDKRYWGDGRCNTNDPGINAYMYRVGWYLPRILTGEFTVEDAWFLFDDDSMLQSIDPISRAYIQRQLR